MEDKKEALMQQGREKHLFLFPFVSDVAETCTTTTREKEERQQQQQQQWCRVVIASFSLYFT